MSKPLFIPVDFDPFAKGELQSIVPTTESQQEIWLSVQMGEDANCAFNLSMALNLSGSLNIEALHFAISAIVQRHESLRSTFSPDGCQLCIAPSLKFDIPLISLEKLSIDEQKQAWQKMQADAVKEPFDLIWGPVFRVKLIRLSPQEHRLLFTAHHIIFDGWSLGVFYAELSTLYNAKKRGEIPKLPDVIPFSEYAIWSQQQMRTEAYLLAENYWLNRLNPPVFPLNLPTDRSYPQERSFKADREDWEISATTIVPLKKIGMSQGATFMITLTAAFEVFLYSLTQQSDFVLGIAIAGQSVSDKLQLIGHCVNLLPSRTQINPQINFLDYLRWRSDTLMSDIEHHQLTFGSLLKKLKLSRQPNRIPLISIRFNVDRVTKPQQLHLDGLTVESSIGPRYYENFELFIDGLETENKLVLRCYYNTDLFEAQTISSYLQEFEKLLHKMVDSPQLAIAQYAELLSPEIQARYLQIPDESSVANINKNGTITPLLQQRTTPKTVLTIDALETKLIEIWENILQIQPISVQDDFFDLGGNSLLMIILGAEIEKQFTIKLPLRSLFSASSIEKLAKIIRQKKSD